MIEATAEEVEQMALDLECQAQKLRECYRQGFAIRSMSDASFGGHCGGPCHHSNGPCGHPLCIWGAP
jgi:hypothetical protein